MSIKYFAGNKSVSRKENGSQPLNSHFFKGLTHCEMQFCEISENTIQHTVKLHMCVQLHILWKLHSAYNTLHTLCAITQKVSNHYTVEMRLVAFNVGKKFTPGRKFLHRHRLLPISEIIGKIDFGKIYFWKDQRLKIREGD